MVIWTDNAISHITEFIDDIGKDTVVLAVLHTRLDIDKALRRLKRNLEK